MRLSAQDRRLFGQAARARKQSIAEFLREAGRAQAKTVGKRRAACLDYPEYDLPLDAERDKDFVARKLRRTKGAP